MTGRAPTATTEAATTADFTTIRYAQVWEDADILLAALDIQPTDTVVSIASAGDNALALLGAGAARVIALDLNPAQLACLELRVAAYRTLTHHELLILMGSRSGGSSLSVEGHALSCPESPAAPSRLHASTDTPRSTTHAPPPSGGPACVDPHSEFGVRPSGRSENPSVRSSELAKARTPNSIQPTDERDTTERAPPPARCSTTRLDLYRRCRPALTPKVAAFWDAKTEIIARGIGTGGKFENYFRLFRTRLLPLVHNRRTVARLLAGGTPAERRRVYDHHWNTWRWRLLFQFFFSRFMMGRLGRDPAFFKYVKGSVADRILGRVEHALTALNPAENPYLHWILTGTHGSALPWALREENFVRIRDRLDRLEWHELTIEAFLARERTSQPGPWIDKLNLSDIFEYMSEAHTAELLTCLTESCRPGARFAYWNMLAPRSRPPSLAHRLKPRIDLAAPLFAQDKAFFYSAFIVEDLQ